MNWQISELVGSEASLFLKAVQLGMEIVFLYDLLRIFRRVVLHNVAGEIVEDLLYWILVGYKMYLLLMTENAGGLRFYIVLGIGIGCILYLNSIGKFFVKKVSGILIKIKYKLFRILYKGKRRAEGPLIKLRNKYHTFQKWADIKKRKNYQLMKKKLTQFCKMIKIVLCKQ